MDSGCVCSTIRIECGPEAYRCRYAAKGLILVAAPSGLAPPGYKGVVAALRLEHWVTKWSFHMSIPLETEATKSELRLMASGKIKRLSGEVRVVPAHPEERKIGVLRGI